MRNLRKCWRYELVECESLAEIKKGDLFRLMPFDETDIECPKDELLIATDDAKPKPDGEPGSVVMTARYILDPDY
jgi:hypothetical protein